MNNHELDPGLRKIWVRYENMKFAVIFAAMLFIFGIMFLRVLPLLGIACDFIAVLMAYYFWLRYFLSPCPKCGDRFASFWGKFMFGFARPTKCQNCGLSANAGSQEIKRLENKK